MIDQRWSRRDRNVAGVVVGLIIMAFGAVLFLDQIGLIDGFFYVPFWPVIIITVGLVKLSHRRPNGRREGGWWVFFGVWLLLHEMDALRFRESWPLLLVAVGIGMVWKEFVRPARPHERVE
jgi:hypothetical protein